MIVKFEAWKLKVPTEAIPWPRNKTAKRASVGAFGYGGANAHFIIEDIESYLKNPAISPELRQSTLTRKGFLYAEAKETTNEPNRPYLLIFSARTSSIVKDYVNTLATSFQNASLGVKRPNLGDLAYTLGIRRSMLPTKAIGVFPATNSDFAEEFKRLSENLVCYPEAMEERRIGFVFTGQGAQWAGMGVELISVFPLVARTLRKLSIHLKMLQDAPHWDIVGKFPQPEVALHQKIGGKD